MLFRSYVDDNSGNIEIQGEILKQFWGNKFSKEAYYAIIHYMKSMNVKTITSKVKFFNLRGLGLITSLGFDIQKIKTQNNPFFPPKYHFLGQLNLKDNESKRSLSLIERQLKELDIRVFLIIKYCLEAEMINLVITNPNIFLITFNFDNNNFDSEFIFKYGTLKFQNVIYDLNDEENLINFINSILSQ